MDVRAQGLATVSPLVAAMLALFGLVNAEPEEIVPLVAWGPALHGDR